MIILLQSFEALISAEMHGFLYNPNASKLLDKEFLCEVNKIGSDTGRIHYL